LVQLLLEDMVNERLDDAGPLAEGRRLGLRVITPEGRAGFLEGHQVRDLIPAGGALTFFFESDRGDEGGRARFRPTT
jgi:hypothetical protein